MQMLKNIIALTKKTTIIHEKNIPVVVTLLYAIFHLLMAIVHEPWFDEAEAWQIARSASLQTLLTEVPHYEGHPPLWHLILMPFAKAGAPYELSLTLISLFFTGTAVYLILRFAPFPMWVRATMPFTYFFFYQYGVVSRVYCVLILEFVLLAMAYKYRNTKPIWYAGVMMLMCVTHAYGIILAGGICIVWLGEIWRENSQQGCRLKSVIYDGRIWCLAGLLVIAIMVILQIMPRVNTTAIYNFVGVEKVRNPFLLRFLYMMLILPADVTMTNVFADDGLLSMTQLSPLPVASGCIVGMIIWVLICTYGKKKQTFCMLIIPYLLFAGFASIVYFALHHMGIGLLFLVFWLWISAEAPDNSIREKRSVIDFYFVKVTQGTIALSLCISLAWTISACVLDVIQDYSPGRRMAEFIRENQLDQYRIMASWNVEKEENGEIISTDVSYCDGVVDIAPYFDRNIVYNFNYGRNDRNYVTHIRADDEENAHAYEAWKAEGYPDVLLMQPELGQLYDAEELSMKDFALVYCKQDERVWKNLSEYHVNYIYVRKDLLPKIGVGQIKVPCL